MVPCMVLIWLGLTPDYGLKNSPNIFVNRDATARFPNQVLNGVLRVLEAGRQTSVLPVETPIVWQ